MKITRRHFLGAAPLAIGAVLQLKGTAFGQLLGASDSDAAADPLSRLNWASFYPYINTRFAFRDSAGTAVNLQLTRMDDKRRPGGKWVSTGEECFAMTFIGSARTPLVQDVYTVEHFALGRFSLLITVVGVQKDRVTYEALINRLTP